jgi:outer membrane receptor protein involved in Fe transport
VPISLDFPAQDNYQETDQGRIGFGVTPNSHWSADASFYFTSATLHVLNPNDPTESTYVDEYLHYDAPRASIVWRPKNDLAVRFAAGGGLAIAPIADFVGTNGAVECEPPNGCYQTKVNLGLQPETSFGYDLGMDKRLGGGTIASLDLYETNLWGQLYENTEDFPPCDTCGGLPLSVTQFQNLASTRYEGVEIDLRHDVPHGYFWSASGSMMRGYVAYLPPGFYNSGGTCNVSTGANCATGTANVVQGVNFNASFTNANVPYAQGFALFGYRWKPQLFVAGDVHYFGNNNGYYAPAFVVFDANASYPLTDHISVQGTFRNITDQDGDSVGNFANGVTYPTAFGPKSYYMSVPYGPRTFLLTFRVHG